jgi:hypothetical protein
MTRPSKRKAKKHVRIPKGPCEPEPPRQPPFPRPTPPWDAPSGPNPLKWLDIGKKKS